MTLLLKPVPQYTIFTTFIHSNHLCLIGNKNDQSFHFILFKNVLSSNTLIVKFPSSLPKVNSSVGSGPRHTLDNINDSILIKKEELILLLLLLRFCFFWFCSSCVFIYWCFSFRFSFILNWCFFFSFLFNFLWFYFCFIICHLRSLLSF